MHHKATERLKSLIDELTNELYIVAAFIDEIESGFISPKDSSLLTLKKLVSFLHKEYKSKIPKIDIQRSILHVISEFIMERFIEKSGFISSILSEHDTNSLKEILADYFSNDSREFIADYPFPCLDNIKELKLDGVNIYQKTYTSQQYNTTRITFSGTGILSNSLNSVASRNSLRGYKAFVMIGFLQKLFTVDESSSDIYSGDFPKPQIFQCLPLTMKDSKYGFIQDNLALKLDVSDFISRIKIKGNYDSENFPQLFSDKMSTATLLIKHAENSNEDAVRIVSALDWAFDCKATKNLEMAFLNTCFGLESLLGETGDEKIPLTEALADRCAYLISKTTSDRKKVKVHFRKIYQLRSKIVHGKTNYLTEDQRETVDLAWAFLFASLVCEINLFKNTIKGASIFSENI